MTEPKVKNETLEAQAESREIEMAEADSSEDRKSPPSVASEDREGDTDGGQPLQKQRVIVHQCNSDPLRHRHAHHSAVVRIFRDDVNSLFETKI